MNAPTQRVRDMTWQTLLTKCRKDALWSANKLAVMDKRLEDLEAEIFNQRVLTRDASAQAAHVDHSLARLERSLGLYLAKQKARQLP